MTGEFFYPFRKLRPTFGEQELRDAVFPGDAKASGDDFEISFKPAHCCSVWHAETSCERTGQRLAAVIELHGFTVAQMVELARRTATATAERVVADRDTAEVARVRITDAGRRALRQHLVCCFHMTAPVPH